MKTPQYSEFSFMLKPSPLGGVGVFATHDIAAGELVLGNAFNLRRLKNKDIPGEFIKYCIYINDDECWAPERFDRLEIGWFINHSETPNIKPSPANQKVEGSQSRPFLVIKPIKAGDEITINYNSLDEPEHLKEEYYKN